MCAEPEGAGAAPIITSFIPGTPLKTTHLQKHAWSIQSSMGAEFRTLGPVASIRLNKKIPGAPAGAVGCRIQDPGTHGYQWCKTAYFSHSAGTARAQRTVRPLRVPVVRQADGSIPWIFSGPFSQQTSLIITFQPPVIRGWGGAAPEGPGTITVANGGRSLARSVADCDKRVGFGEVVGGWPQDSGAGRWVQRRW